MVFELKRKGALFTLTRFCVFRALLKVFYDKELFINKFLGNPLPKEKCCVFWSFL
jgi:hypothetical protein